MDKYGTLYYCMYVMHVCSLKLGCSLWCYWPESKKVHHAHKHTWRLQLWHVRNVATNTAYIVTTVILNYILCSRDNIGLTNLFSHKLMSVDLKMLAAVLPASYFGSKRLVLFVCTIMLFGTWGFVILIIKIFTLSTKPTATENYSWPFDYLLLYTEKLY